MSTLKTEALGVVYGNGVRALETVDLTIERGSLVAILGASGSGKSTLLRTLNGLVAPSSGRVVESESGVLAGARKLRNHRRRTGMIFQQHHLIGRCTVLDNVLTGRLAYRGSLASLLPWPRIDKEIALGALERVGLIDRALDRADMLSGGQQQRVGIARALAQQPRILLADEPVASLDPATADQVLRLLRDICKTDGLTAIVSLHQVELARAFAERIVGLRTGKVVFDGAPAGFDDAAAARLYTADGAPARTPAPNNLILDLEAA